MGKETDKNDARLRAHIRTWMVENLARFIDECGEVNCTLITETWDLECADGGATLEEDHPAWEVAVDIAAEHTMRHVPLEHRASHFHGDAYMGPEQRRVAS